MRRPVPSLHWHDRPDFNGPESRQRILRNDLKGIVQIDGVDQNEPAELFLGLRKWSVSCGEPAVPHPDRYCRLHRLERLAGDELSSPAELVEIVQRLAVEGVPPRPVHPLEHGLFEIDQTQVLHGTSRGFVPRQ
jgi:hypothetical protein